MKINTNIDLFSRYVKYITYRNNLRNKKLIYIFLKKGLPKLPKIFLKTLFRYEFKLF